MILSLDTNVMVDIINGRRLDVRQRFDEARADGHQLVASSLAMHELIYGAMISRRPNVQLPAAQEFLDDIELVDWSEPDATAAAKLRAELRRRGQTIGFMDMLIAGQAIARKWTVVSANLRDFNRVQGLSVLDWTDQSPPEV